VADPQPPQADTTRPAFEHRPEKRGLIGPFSARQLVAVLLVVVVAGVVLVAATTPLGSINPPALADPQPTAYLVGSPTVGLRPGSLAPELAGMRGDGSTWQLLDVTGKPVRLAAHRGHGVWINFWASWCGPCQSETPTLRAMDEAYRAQGLDLIGISVKESTASDVNAYAQRYDLGYTIAADLIGDVKDLYGVYALPTQVFIDAKGVVRAVVNGPLSQAQARAYIATILPPAGGSGPLSPSLSPSLP
jgi:cytochrome c biogenesis protein CcmG/thiol:disulfide interchange protein DsbE